MFRPLALAVLFLVALASGCGGSGGSEQNDRDGADAPAGLNLLIYKETLGNAVFAELLPGERSWRFSGETEGEFLLAMDCTRDGQRAAYLTQSAQSGIRLKISGKPEPIPIPGYASGVAWAPDGSQIALTTFDATSSAHQLQLVDPQSGEVSIAASGRGAIGPPRWSPDGSRIAFDASGAEWNEIFVHNIGAEGSSKVKERPSHAFGPDWSPDGLTLVFSAPDPAGMYQIFSMNADGANETQLTTSNVGKSLPRWAPDGSLIAFEGTIVVPTVSEQPVLVHNMAVYTIRPDGTDERAITDLARDARLGGWCVSGPWLAEDWKEAE